MKIPVSLLLLAAASTAGAAEALWLRDVRISPDGSRIAFEYKGDICTATRITSRDSYEEKPVWSPDGKSIAFASDRFGNPDIFIVSADGGTPRRLTFNSATEYPEAFTPDGKSVLYSAAIQNPASSAMFPKKYRQANTRVSSSTLIPSIRFCGTKAASKPCSGLVQ